MFILRLEITDPGDNKNILEAIVGTLCSAAYFVLYPCYPLRQAIDTKFTIALCSHSLFYWGVSVRLPLMVTHLPSSPRTWTTQYLFFTWHFPLIWRGLNISYFSLFFFVSHSLPFSAIEF